MSKCSAKSFGLEDSEDRLFYTLSLRMTYANQLLVLKDMKMIFYVIIQLLKKMHFLGVTFR